MKGFLAAARDLLYASVFQKPFSKTVGWPARYALGLSAEATFGCSWRGTCIVLLWCTRLEQAVTADQRTAVSNRWERHLPIQHSDSHDLEEVDVISKFSIMLIRSLKAGFGIEGEIGIGPFVDTLLIFQRPDDGARSLQLVDTFFYAWCSRRCASCC